MNTTYSRRHVLRLLGGVAGSTLAGALLVGCGVTGEEPDYTIEMLRGATFTPANLIIPVGSRVAWHNRADTLHTVTADPALADVPGRVLLPAGANPWNSGDIHPGERWVYTFDTLGTYIYFCRYHQDVEMFARITLV